MIISATISQTGYIAITLTAALVAVGLIVLLFFMTRHERKRYKENKLQDMAIRTGKLDEEMKDRLSNATAKTKFNIISYNLIGADVVIARYGRAGYSAVIEVLERRIRKALKMPMTICPYGRDRLIVVTDKALVGKKIKAVLGKSLSSVRQPITMADSVAISLQCKAASVQYPACGKEYLELLGVLDKASAVVFRSDEIDTIVYNDGLIDQESYSTYAKLNSDIASKVLNVRYCKVRASDSKIYALSCDMRYMGVEQNAVYKQLAVDSGDLCWIEQSAIYTIAAAVKKITKAGINRIIINPHGDIECKKCYVDAVCNAVKLSGVAADSFVVNIDTAKVGSIDTVMAAAELYKASGVGIVLSDVDMRVPPQQISAIGAKYVIVEGMVAAGGGENAAQYIKALQEGGVEVIVGNITTAVQLVTVSNLNVDAVMGDMVGEYMTLGTLLGG